MAPRGFAIQNLAVVLTKFAHVKIATVAPNFHWWRSGGFAQILYYVSTTSKEILNLLTICSKAKPPCSQYQVLLRTQLYLYQAHLRILYCTHA
jgi:hypothetical protein